MTHPSERPEAVLTISGISGLVAEYIGFDARLMHTSLVVLMLEQKTQQGQIKLKHLLVQMTPVGLEPTIPGSVGRCLIHWVTGPAG